MADTKSMRLLARQKQQSCPHENLHRKDQPQARTYAIDAGSSDATSADDLCPTHAVV